MTGRLTHKPPTRRDTVDAVRLKKAGDPRDQALLGALAHINEREAALLARELPAAQGPVIGTGLLAEAGRRGDTLITDINRAEAKLLKRHGGSGTRNPATGLLEFGDGMGGSDNPGGGHDASAAGSPGSSGGYGGGYGGGVSSSSSGGYGGNTSFSDYTNDPTMGPGGVDDTIGTYSQNGGYVNWSDYAMNGYKAADTWGRVLQEMWSPSVPTSKYGPTTGTNLGIAGAIAGGLVGGPMSGLMGIGAAMGRAQSPESQRASMAEQAATGSKNSTGQDNASGRGSQAAGAASGAETAGALAQDLRTSGTQTAAMNVPAGYTVNPAGQVIPLPDGGGSHTLTGLPQPVQNLLMDYIWRGRQGSGLLGW
jgi:hypothetical protein